LWEVFVIMAGRGIAEFSAALAEPGSNSERRTEARR